MKSLLYPGLEPSQSGQANTYSKNPHIPDRVVKLDTEHRYRGFPGGMMEAPHVPLTYSPRAAWSSDHTGPAAPTGGHPPLAPIGTSPNYRPSMSTEPPVPTPNESNQQRSQRTYRIAPPPLPPVDMPNMEASQPWSQQRRNFSVDADIQKLKEEKRRKMLADELEKKQNLHLLQNYNPWGRPGGGAPRDTQGDDHRRMKFTEDGPAEGVLLNSPGGGAPLRDRDGRLVTELPGDRLIRFREGPRSNRALTEPIRYKAAPELENEYAKQLEMSMLEKAAKEQRQRVVELQEEINSLNYDPFGRPGAGAPNPRQIGRGQDPQSEMSYDPWGKGYGQPRRDADGNVLRYNFHNIVEGNTLPPPGGREGNRRSNSDERLEFGTSLNVGQRTDPGPAPQAPAPRPHIAPPPLPTAESGTIYFPFGSPGGGAPNRDREGNIVAKMFGPSPTVERDLDEERKKVLASKVYSEDLEHDIMQRRLNALQEQQKAREPMSDMSEILQQGRTGRPRRDEETGLLLNHPRISSDVTGMKPMSQVPVQPFSNNFYSGYSGYANNYLPQTSGLSKSTYGMELERAAEERRRARELERLQEIHESRKHLKSFDEMWGRPGGGAPRADGTQRVNFDQALHYPQVSPAPLPMIPAVGGYNGHRYG